jgi:thioredoxin 1
MKKILSLLLISFAFGSTHTKTKIKTKSHCAPEKKAVVKKKEVKKVTTKKETKKSLVTIVDATTFEKEVLKSKHPIILDVFADWCGPCRRMAPIFEEVAEKFKDKKIKFVKIKMDSFEESDKHIKLLKDKLKASIQMIPTFLHIENGKLVKTIVGSQSADKLTSTVNEILKK